jgi:hypothetical protein
MPPNDSTTTSDDPSPRDLPSQRGETWNDTEAINRHRLMTPSERVALCIEISRAALMFEAAGRRAREKDQAPPDRN